MWMTLCFRAWMLRGGHSLHLSILCVRKHLGCVPWDTFSIINEARKILQCPPPSKPGLAVPWMSPWGDISHCPFQALYPICVFLTWKRSTWTRERKKNKATVLTVPAWLTHHSAMYTHCWHSETCKHRSRPNSLAKIHFISVTPL